MNARQKAKKYKRAYEALTAKWKPPIELKKEEYKIDTLNVSMILPKESALLGDDYIRKIVIDSFAEELAKCTEKYIDGYTEYLPYDGRSRLHYQMKVLRRTNNDNNKLLGLHIDNTYIDECAFKITNQESEE